MWDQFIEEYQINASSAAKSFMNGKPLELLSDDQLLSNLNKSIASYSYQDEIFNHPQFEKLLLTLFCHQKINWLQICTEIERFLLRKLQSTLYYFPLLNETGTGFSNESKEILLPQFIYTLTGPGKFDNRQLNLLLDICKKFPKSEQYFIACLHDELVISPKTSSRNIKSTLSANESLFSIQLASETRMLFLSFSLKNAIGLVIYQQQWFAHLGCIGKLDKDDIEQGIRKKIRYTSLPFSTYQDLGKVHDYEDVSVFTLIMHDYYHSRVCASIPSVFHDAMNRIIDCVRAQIKIKWTVALWLLTDREFKHFFYNHGIDYRNISFGCFLDYGTGGETLSYQSGGLFVASKMTRQIKVHLNITDVGILTFLDMAKNKSEWNIIGISSSTLKYDYSRHYTYADSIKSELFNHFCLDMLLYRIFVLLRDIHKLHFAKQIIFQNINYWKHQLNYTEISRKSQATLFKGVKYKNELLEKNMVHAMHDLLLMGIHDIMPNNEYELMNAITVESIKESDVEALMNSFKYSVTKIFFLDKLLLHTNQSIHQAKYSVHSFSWKSLSETNLPNRLQEKINELAYDIFSVLSSQEQEIMILAPLNFGFKIEPQRDSSSTCSIL